MTDQANPSLGKIEDLFKTLVWDNLFQAGITAFFVSNPGLTFWPLRQIITGIARIISDKQFQNLKLAVDLQAIVLTNEAHKRAFDTASVALMIIAKDKGIDSQEFKNARENAKVALSKFVTFN